MLEAIGWGVLAQSSVLLAGLVVCWITVPTKLVGILGGLGGAVGGGGVLGFIESGCWRRSPGASWA
jgi:hypothetical protein